MLIKSVLVAIVMQFVIMTGVIVYTVHGVAVNHSVLCKFEENIRKSRDASLDYLSKPHKPIPGISDAQIQSGINRQTATLVSLRGLHCPVN